MVATANFKDKKKANKTYLQMCVYKTDIPVQLINIHILILLKNILSKLEKFIFLTTT